jgi:para-aminobenzoate synthetase component 1
MSRLPAADMEVRRVAGAADPLGLLGALARRNLPVILQSSLESGRYSIVASDPFLVLRAQRGRGSLRGLQREEVFDGDPFPVLRAVLDAHRVERVPGLPFAGGAIGYLGYPLRRFAGARGAEALAPSAWPDLHLAFYDHAVVVDHAAGCTTLVSSGMGAGGEARRREKRRLDLARLRHLLDETPDRKPRDSQPAPGVARFLTPKAEYLRRIERAREYLAAGDIYQVNLSHRIEVAGAWDPPELYRRLVEAHPCAFGAYLPLPEGTVLCASPERFVRLTGRHAETSPIKGTRARACDGSGDAAGADALRAGPKERAENVMIVDLARNDLGRVCEAGSVRVDELCAVETLPSVHHLVSRVSGRLREEADGVDLVRALFPGGSMTGAPKLRAMEIIDELEGIERGVYSGSLGYFSLDGDLDLNIVIRTLLVSAGRAELQVGGAVLAESDPEAEYQETLDKARPLLELLAGTASVTGEGAPRERA